MCRTSFSIAFFLWACAAACAGPMPAREIPAQAKWVIHLDVEAILKSSFGEPILEIANDPMVAPRLAAFTAMFGMNLVGDIHGMTLWGFGNNDHQAALYLEGKYDRVKLETIVRAAENYREIPYGAARIHAWRDKGKNLYGCFVREDLLALSKNQALVEAAIDAAHGRGGEFGLVPGGKTEAALAVVACQSMAGMELNPQAAVLKRIQEGWGALREEGGSLNAEIYLKAENAEVATQIRQTLEGFRALALLNAQQQPMLASLAAQMSVSAEADTVRVVLSCAKEMALNLWRDGLKKEMAKHQQASPTSAEQGK